MPRVSKQRSKNPAQLQLRLDSHYNSLGYPFETSDFYDPTHMERKKKKIEEAEQKQIQKQQKVNRQSKTKDSKEIKNFYKRRIFDFLDRLSGGKTESQLNYELKIGFLNLTGRKENFDTYFTNNEKESFRDHYLSKNENIKGWKAKK